MAGRWGFNMTTGAPGGPLLAFWSWWATTTLQMMTLPAQQRAARAEKHYRRTHALDDERTTWESDGAMPGEHTWEQQADAGLHDLSYSEWLRSEAGRSAIDEGAL